MLAEGADPAAVGATVTVALCGHWHGPSAEWVDRGGQRARLYELTRAGRTRLAAAESQWRASTAAVNRVLKMV